MTHTTKSKVYPISEGAFEIVDYDRENLKIEIHVDGQDHTDEIELAQDDILSAAMAYRIIDSFYDPAYNGANFRVEIEEIECDFSDWWSNVDPADTERLFMGAITTKAAMGLEKVVRELFQVSVAA